MHEDPEAKMDDIVTVESGTNFHNLLQDCNFNFVSRIVVRFKAICSSVSLKIGSGFAWRMLIRKSKKYAQLATVRILPVPSYLFCLENLFIWIIYIFITNFLSSSLLTVFLNADPDPADFKMRIRIQLIKLRKKLPVPHAGFSELKNLNKITYNYYQFPCIFLFLLKKISPLDPGGEIIADPDPQYRLLGTGTACWCTSLSQGCSLLGCLGTGT